MFAILSDANLSVLIRGHGSALHRGHQIGHQSVCRAVHRALNVAGSLSFRLFCQTAEDLLHKILSQAELWPQPIYAFITESFHLSGDGISQSNEYTPWSEQVIFSRALELRLGHRETDEYHDVAVIFAMYVPHDQTIDLFVVR